MNRLVAAASLLVLGALAGCPDNNGPQNPPRLWLHAVEVVGTIELVESAPPSY
jgi:hypothetical protein